MMDTAVFTDEVVREFRANTGRVGQLEGYPLLLLTTTGARSGRPHLTPLVHVSDGERLIVIASAGGAPGHPAWFRNLVANPRVTVELGDDTFAATAVVVEGPERDRLWKAVTASQPQFRDYQAKTTRRIPVVALDRVEDEERLMTRPAVAEDIPAGDTKSG